jgi:hypothetical protein
MPLPCVPRPAKGVRRVSDAASRRPSSSGRGARGARCEVLTPCLDWRGEGSRPVAEAECGAATSAPMGRKGCVRGAGAPQHTRLGLSRVTRGGVVAAAVATAAVAAAAAAEAAEAATVAGAKALGSNDMTESGLRRDSSVTPGLPSSRSMMRVAARSVKPSSGLVCTKWPAPCASRRRHVERGVCRCIAMDRVDLG